MAQRKSDEDKTVKPGASLTVLRAIREYRREAEDAKRSRMLKSQTNVRTYLGEQDWSHKQAGQSREFLPKVPVAVEQFSAFVKRALIQFGDWFSVEVGKGDFPLTEQQVRNLMKCFLGSLADGLRAKVPFHIRLSDGIKQGLLESLVIFKVHGYKVSERVFFAERGIKMMEMEGGERRAAPQTRLKEKNLAPWRLAIDLIKPADYFPDPTNRKLYKIHRVERDLHDVIELSKQGIYDPEAVDELVEDFAKKEDEWEEARKKNQDYSNPPAFRHRVVIEECWGDILDENGRIAEKNSICALANDKFLIRPPEQNPYWHREDPFVDAPLIRVPDSVWHKAVFDHASSLNIALNEIFSLMLDGGLASVWGIKQIRTGGLEDPRQVSGGIPQGTTLAVKDEFPQGQKVLETVAEGEVPGDALAMFNLLDREFNVSAYTNDMKMGLLAPKQVRATEVVEIQQSQAVTLDGISSDVEQMLIEPTLRKAWLVIMQNADDISAPEIVNAIGYRAALLLSRMKPAERFAAFAQGYSFKVHGLSATLGRVRDFQKFAALSQMVQGNPILLQAFLKKYSGDKILTSLIKYLNINPEHLELSEDEKARQPQIAQEIGQLYQVTGQAGSGGSVKQEETGGDPAIPAEVNQQINPLTGMV